MKIPFLQSRESDHDPDDTFRAFASEDLAPRARQELARMRLQCGAQGVKPYPGQCDDCPGRADPMCCWNTEDYKTGRT